jgi:hypothetical protein
MKAMDSLRIFLANTGSWLATIITFAAVENVMRLMATMGSICVSVVSVWWIIKQARSLNKDK